MEKPRILFVEDEPSLLGVLPDIAALAGLEGKAFSFVEFQKALSTGYFAGQYYDGFSFDCLFEGGDLLDILAAFNAKVEEYREKGSWAGRPLPKIIILSGAENEFIQRIIEKLPKNPLFLDISILTKPVKVDALRQLFFPAATAPELPAAKEPKISKSPSLNDVLRAFENFRQSFERPESDPARKATEENFRDGLQRLDPMTLMSPYLATVKQPKKDMGTAGFSFSAGDSINGRIAFSMEDIESLRAADASAPIALALREIDAETYGQLCHVQGVIVLGEGGEHFSQNVRSVGAAGLLTKKRSEHGTRLGLGEDDAGPYLSFCGKRTCLLRRGDWVTLDTNHKRLYAGKLPIIPPAMPLLYDEFVAYARRLLSRCKSELPKDTPAPLALRFSFQADQTADMDIKPPHICLSRSENIFLDKTNRDALVRALLFPTKNNLDKLTKQISSYVRGLLRNDVLNSVTFRLMDFKPEQILTPAQETILKERHGLDDLRGFVLAQVLPNVYEAQVVGVLDALPGSLDISSRVYFAVPRTETAGDVVLAKKIIGSRKIHLSTNGENECIRPLLCPAIETRKGAGNAAGILAACANANREAYREGDELPVLLGTGDMATDILGFRRNDALLIQKYMDENPSGGQPFLKLFMGLADEIEKISGAAHQVAAQLKSAGEKGVTFVLSLCGEHATFLPNFPQLESLGVDAVCVPSKPLYAQGLKNAYALDLLQRLWRSHPLPNLPSPA